MPSTAFLYTLNNYTGAAVAALKIPRSEIGYMCFAHEVGASGTPHLQGYFQLTRQVKKTTIIKWPGFKGMHLISPNGTDEQNYTYIKGPYDDGKGKTKPENDTFFEYGIRQTMGTAGKRNDLDKVHDDIKDGKTYAQIVDAHFATAARYHRFIREQIQVRDSGESQRISTELLDYTPKLPWQKKLLEDLNGPIHRRQIIWIWSEHGKRGKSDTTEYLRLKMNAHVITGGKMVDIAHNWSKNPSTICIFDLSRTCQEKMDHLYGLAESLKNGCVTSTKYDGGNIYQRCHVIFFTNFPPDPTKWSEDRYDIRDVEGEEL